MLNEIPVQAPDGQPFRLLTLRNDARDGRHTHGLGRDTALCTYSA